MFLPLLFFTLITLLLYLTSRSLTKNIFQFFYHLTKSQDTAANLLFFLLLPGIFLHEFGHILSAELLRVPTGHLSLKPQFKHNQLKLGSAQIATTDPFRLTLIGTAPFILGLFTLWALLKFGLNIELHHFNLNNLFVAIYQLKFTNLLIGYLILTTANTMFSSPSDLQAAALPIILLLLLSGAFKLAGHQLSSPIIAYSTNLLILISTIFTLTLILNLILLLPLKFLNHRH